MNQNPSTTQKIYQAFTALREGNGVLIQDDADRENEADLIFAAELLTPEKMAVLIRECSGIVCLCLTQARVTQLQLPMMVSENTSCYQTPFTVSIEAKQGVTTGVSAKDRTTTILTAISESCQPDDLARPGHVFPLCAHSDGVLGRVGHTEAAVDLMRLAGLRPYGVLCELMNPDGTMAKGDQITRFATEYGYPVLSVADVVAFRKHSDSCS